MASKMRGAISTDPGAAPDTWRSDPHQHISRIMIGIFRRKWDGRNFTRANLVEDSARFRDIYGKKLPNGEHPTIHWNR